MVPSIVYVTILILTVLLNIFVIMPQAEAIYGYVFDKLW